VGKLLEEIGSKSDWEKEKKHQEEASPQKWETTLIQLI
jgi:hypothetical protein